MHDFPSCIRVTADVGCAYLNARMPKHDPDELVFIKIDPDIATLLVEVDSNMLPFVCKDGSITADHVSSFDLIRRATGAVTSWCYFVCNVGM